MKRRFLILTLLFTQLIMSQNFERLEPKNWRKSKFISGRIAREKDIENGSAVFCLKDDNESHKAYKIELPNLAYLNNEETKKKETIILMQVETSSKGILVGYRDFEGASGVCFLNEISLLSKKEIEKLLHKN